MAVTAVATLVPYLAILWNLRLDPLRTALTNRQFSNFYDLQARALLDGNLSLPEGVLGIEAFIVDGRSHMYFPPGPALARIPVLLVTDAFDGRLTAVSMLLAWIATTLLVTLLVWRVRHVLRGAVPIGRAETAGYGLLLVGSTVGSVLLFLGSLPWVYHEAYAWATVMSLGAAFCLLGVIERPTGRRVLATGAFVLGAMLCRTTAGWACAGAAGLTALWFLARRRDESTRPLACGLLLACVLPLQVGVTINEARFDHPFLFPLENQVWTEVNEQRRLTLAANGGDLVSAGVIPHTAAAYFRPDGIRLTDVFPFLSFPADPPSATPGGHLDQTYRTGSVVAFMPALSLLAVWGMFTAFRRRGPEGAALLRIPLLGALAISGAIMVYGYIAYRYTSELMPVLVLAAVVGLVDLARRLDGGPRTWRLGALGALVGLVGFGVAANAAVAFSSARFANGGEGLERYVTVQERLSALTPGDPIGGLVSQSAELPRALPPDHLHIVADCDALYVSTGETFSPWMPVELRELRLRVHLHPLPDRAVDRAAFDVPLAQVVDDPSQSIRIQRDGEGRYRLVYGGTTLLEPEQSAWITAAPEGVIEVTVRPRLRSNELLVVIDGNIAMHVPSTDGFPEHFVYELSDPAPEALREAGLEIRALGSPTPDTCRRLLRFVR